MLELAVEADVDLVTAAKIALGSMMSTARANLSVGPPYDVGIYLNDTRTISEFRIESDSPLLHKLSQVWERQLLDGIAQLPPITQDDVTEVRTRSEQVPPGTTRPPQRPAGGRAARKRTCYSFGRSAALTWQGPRSAREAANDVPRREPRTAAAARRVARATTPSC